MCRDAARIGVHQDALLAVQFADHEKLVPPMHLEARKACRRSDQSVDGSKISLQIVSLSRIAADILNCLGFFCLTII
jgi:hypothetical protein